MSEKQPAAKEPTHELSPNWVTRNPVTKAELEQLRAQREKPTPSLDYTMGGETKRIVHTRLAQQRYEREVYIEERLGRMQGKAENDFGKAKMKDRARHDFERSR